MERIEEFTRDGKNFILIDFSGLTKEHEFRELTEQVKQIIVKYPEKSVYTISNVENIRFDTSVKNIFVDYMRYNKPYVKNGTAIGIDGIKKILITTVSRLSGRKTLAFCYSKEEAVNYLLNSD